MAELGEDSIPGIVQQVLNSRERERRRLDKIQAYYKGKHNTVYQPKAAGGEYKWISERARINVLPLVVSVVAQNLHVDGYRMSPPPIPKSIEVGVESMPVPPGTPQVPSQGAQPPQGAPAANGSPAGSGGGAGQPPSAPVAQGATLRPGRISIPTGLVFDDTIAEIQSEPWKRWLANKMDSKQHGLYRSICKFGLGYTVVLPGSMSTGNGPDNAPERTAIIRPVSPRRMTAFYADEADDEWPVFAAEIFDMRTLGGKKRVVRIYDDKRRYTLIIDNDRADPRFVTGDDGLLDGSTAIDEHDLGVCPVIRYVHEIDLDGETDVTGEIEPLMNLQDQLNSTKFGMMIAQSFASFRQRWVTGMEVDDSAGRAKQPFNPGVDRLWVAEDADTKFGEFGQTDLKDYLSDITNTEQNMATIAQVPPYQLLGLVANLSAEALAAARDGLDRKVQELQGTISGPHKQTFQLSSHAAGDDKSAKDNGAEVAWRDTSARAFAATIDGLGKMSQSLGVPAPELWTMIPGVSAEMAARWKASLAQPGVMDELADLVNKAITKGSNPETPGSPGAVPYNQYEARPGGV